ncbi:unnamed protein product, partial [Polarella glacialis]
CCLLSLISAIAALGPEAAEEPQVAQALEAECECQGLPDESCSIKLLQLQGRKKQVAAAAESSAVATELTFEEYEASVDEIINAEFANVTGFGGFLSDFVGYESVFAQCTAGSWSKLDAKFEGEKTYDGIMRKLGFQEMNGCDTQTGKYRNDPTCMAINALAAAMFKLEDKFPDGPKFLNYLLVAWGSEPSWLDGAVEVDWDVMPPKGKVLNPNAANGYGFCDIVRTVLSQSADQMSTGTCGYVASLAALSHRAPAKALKMGLRLMWTGRPSQVIDYPCDYIFKEQPGLVPYQDRNGWHPSFFNDTKGMEKLCSGNAVDCSRATGAPYQNAGLTFMWTQSLQASFGREVSGKCSDKGAAMLNFPGQSAENVARVQGSQGMVPGSAIWSCNAVIDPEGGSCRTIINYNICGWMGDGDCKVLFDYQVDSEDMGQVIQVLSSAISSLDESETFFDTKNTRAAAKATIVALEAHFRGASTRLIQYKEFLIGITRKYGLNWLTVLINMNKPQATEAMLEEACKAPIAVLAIDSDPLQPPALFEATLQNPINGSGYPFGGLETGQVNHAVFLEKCDPEKNVYTLWTWGQRTFVTKELLLGKPVQSYPHLNGTRDGFYTSGILGWIFTAQNITWSPTTKTAQNVFRAQQS